MNDELRILFKKYMQVLVKGEGLKVVWTNDKTREQITTPHLLISVDNLTPEPTDICMVGARHEWLATTIVRIRDDEGESKAMQLVDKIVSYTSPDKDTHRLKELCGKFGNYRFIRLPDPKLSLTSKGWFAVPVDNRLELLT